MKRVFAFTIGLLLFALVGMACKKSLKDSCVQIQVPSTLATSQKLPKLKRANFLLKSLLKNCPKIPQPIRTYLKNQVDWYEFDPSEAAKPLGPLVKLSDYPGFWNRACPGVPLKDWKKVERLSYFEKESYLFKNCGGNGARYLTKKELNVGCSGNKPGFLLGAVLFQWLLDAGVKEADARRFVREGYLAGHRPGEIPLLPWTSGKPLEHMTTIEVMKAALLVNRKRTLELIDGRVDPAMKKDLMASSYFIIPLYESLKQAKLRRLKLAKFTKKPFQGKLLMYIHPKTSFRLLAEVMYTAGQAEFGKMYFAVAAKRPPYQGCTQMLPLSVPKLRTFQKPKKKTLGTLNLTLSLSKKHLHLITRGHRVGKGCNLKAFTQTHKQYLQKDGRYLLPPSTGLGLVGQRNFPIDNTTLKLSNNKLSALLDKRLSSVKGITVTGKKRSRHRRRSRRSRKRRKASRSHRIKAPKITTPVVMGPFLPKRKDLILDIQEYRACLLKIKKFVPYDKRLIIMAEPEITFQELIEFIRASWLHKDGNPLYQEIILSAGMI